ncbi:hypothetical protein [Streptomyces monomycini]|uniref:hypothetical protein n=1 Tax=Streptomyces monomycini TaxID=371720 RepID=UPI0012FEF4F1|nr:hypothetical protein [Streptomyces monomycini]
MARRTHPATLASVARISGKGHSIFAGRGRGRHDCPQPGWPSGAGAAQAPEEPEARPSPLWWAVAVKAAAVIASPAVMVCRRRRTARRNR